MEEKDLFEKINEESQKNIPNEYNKILFAAREQGLFTNNAVGANAQSDGKTVALYGVTKKERNIIAIAVASLTAVCLAIALPVGLSKSPSLPPIGDGNDNVDDTTQTIAADFDLGEQYAAGAVAASKLAEVYLGDSAEAAFMNYGDVMLISERTAVYPDENGIERYISEFDNYFYACNSFFGEKPANVETVENHDSKYDNSIIISGKFSNGDTAYYAMYYSEARIVGDTTVTGTEVKYYLEGYLILNGKHYFMYGERVYTDSTKAMEKSLSLTAYPVNENKNSRVEMSLEYGVGGSVNKYEFNVYKDSAKISESVVTIPDNGDTAYTVEFSGDDGTRDGKFTVDRPQTGWESLKVNYEIGNLTSSFYVKATANTLERVVAPDGLEYLDNGDGTYTLSGYRKTVTMPSELFIPAEFDGKKVVKVGNWAFNGCNDLQRVIVPEGITCIGNGAFYSCKNITEIVLPQTLTDLENSAFCYCKSLVKINLPDNLINIGTFSFRETSVENIVIPGKVELIDTHAFSLCSKLKSLHISASVKFIGKGNSSGTAIESLTIDKANENYYVESGCLIEKENKKVIASQTNFKIPDDIKIIGEFTFEECKYLKDLVVPASVKEIGTSAFYSSSLESIVLKGVEKIENSAFNYSKLKNISLPETLVSIGGSAFQRCSDLTSLNLPASLRDITASAIFYCNSLKTITVAAGNPKYHSVDNCVIETGTFTLVIGCADSVIPADGSVTVIGEGAFAYRNWSNNGFIIPSGITKISENAFYECPRLLSIEIPDSVTEIGDYAFYNCYSLQGVIWNAETSNLTKIGYYAFCACTDLRRIDVPAKVTTVEIGAFSYCMSLGEVKFYSDDTFLRDRVFEECETLRVITLPKNSMWKLPDRLFKNCINLEIVFVGNIDSIGEQAFYGCSHLKEIRYFGYKKFLKYKEE